MYNKNKYICIYLSGLRYNMVCTIYVTSSFKLQAICSSKLARFASVCITTRRISRSTLPNRSKAKKSRVASRHHLPAAGNFLVFSRTCRSHSWQSLQQIAGLLGFRFTHLQIIRPVTAPLSVDSKEQ